MSKSRQQSLIMCEKPEKPIGIFVEECKEGENTKPLTFDELYDYVIPTYEKISSSGWTNVGFETGREYNEISFKIDVRDADIESIENWNLERNILKGASQEETNESRVPGKEDKKWAVEFPIYDPEFRFVRRYFYFRSKYHVPELLRRGKKAKI